MDIDNIMDGIKSVNPELGKLAEDAMKKINDAESSLKKVNLIVAGKSGVGKSTLINACFRKKLADTGIGRPVTSETQIIEDNKMPLRIYDTVGLELTESTKKSTINDIHKLIEGNRGTEKEIHCVWYCVLAGSNRLEQAEEDLIADIKSLNVPVILVLTQAYKKDKAEKLKQIIWNEIGTKANTILLNLAEGDEDDKAYGKDNLIKSTCDYIADEELKISLINASISWPLKFEKAMKAVYAGCASAAVAAIAPIPVADTIAIGAVQVPMMAQISSVYGVSMNKTELIRVLGALLGLTTASFAGRAIFAGLVKTIPGVGTIAGGAIGATTAVILTYALGRTYIFIMEKVCKNEASLDNLDMELINRIMKTNMSKATEYLKQSITNGKFDSNAFERISEEQYTENWADIDDEPIKIDNTPPKVPPQYRKHKISNKGSNKKGLLESVAIFFSKKK